MYNNATNNKPILYPEAVLKVQNDLNYARTDWDYLSGISGRGPIAEFEHSLSEIFESDYVIALSNATSALFSALIAESINEGDEVILPGYTWPQTLTPVLLSGATPVFADIDDNTVTLSPDSVRNLITPKTRAIIAVHLYGIPAHVMELRKIARENDLILIYDAAQGFGSFFNNKPIASYGNYVAFSFGRSKLLSVGEGGALVCRTRQSYERVIAFSQHPLRMHHDIDDFEMRRSIDGVSMNFRIHPLIASLAVGQLKGLINSEYLAKLKNQFNSIYDVISSSGLSMFLPEIPEAAIPNGTCLPLIFRENNNFSDYKSIFSEMGIETYEDGLQKPLHLSFTISRKRLMCHEKSGNVKLSENYTHRSGSCPNTEERCKKKQLFVKLA